MTTCKLHLVVTLMFAVLTTVDIPDAAAFKLTTHETINERAAGISGTGSYLKNVLGLKDGLVTTFRRKSDDERTGLRWILFGGGAEDLFDESEWFGALYRSRNHFHNPLLTWDASGLRTFSLCPPFIVRGESSPRWAQNADQGQSGQAAWADARKAYFEALTLWAVVDRDDGWTRTLQVLGQQMHLVADLAVPAHTRNDTHCPVSDRFEAWALRNKPRVDSILSATLQPVDPSIFSINVPVDDQVAKVPIARLMDTDQYDGTNPTDTMRLTVGLAEYTNANFFSDHTVFEDHRWGDPSFRYPSFASVELGNEEDGPGGVRRRYFLKTQDGDTGYRLAVPSALYESLPEALRDQEKALDDKVLEDYAARLLPKAVSYSAALVDYFFRGKLEATLEGDPANVQRLLLKGRNASSEALEGGGTLAVYGDYAGGAREPLASWTLLESVAPGDLLPGQPLAFSPPTDRPVPERYMVVYQGSLGEEKKDNPPGFGGAVIGKAAKYVGIIEQLFVNAADGDVYFRNGTLVTKLNVRSQLPSGSLVILRSWGTRNDTFLVEGGVPGEDVSYFYVFTLNRPRPDQVFRDPPVATLVRAPEFFDPFFMRSQLPPFARPQVLNYRALLDDNLNVILPGDYCLDIPDPFHMEREECHALVVNHTARTIVFDLPPSTLGAPSAGLGFTGVFASMVLHLDASNPGESRIVVEGFHNIYADNDSYRVYLGVVDGNGSVVTTLMGWEPFRMASYLQAEPQRGGRHLMWVKSDDNDTRVYLSSLVDGTSTEIGVGEADVESVWAASLLSVAPDHLLRTASPPYFVKGWTADGTVVLPRVGTPGFPPEDPDLASVKRLADPPLGVSFPTGSFCGWSLCSLWQVIEDPDMLR